MNNEEPLGPVCTFLGRGTFFKFLQLMMLVAIEIEKSSEFAA